MIQTITKPNRDHPASAFSARAVITSSDGHPHGPTQEQIAQCAYDIYIAHGRADGRNDLNWRQAEEELAQTAEAAAHKAAVDSRT
jgi:hypothetical protein